MALRILIATLLLALAWAEETTIITITELMTEYTATTIKTTSRTPALLCSIRSSMIPNTPTMISATVTSYCECADGITLNLATTQSGYGAPATICATDHSSAVESTPSGSWDSFGGAIYSVAQLYNSIASPVQSTNSPASQETVQTSTLPSSGPSASSSEGTTSGTEATMTDLGGAPAETAFATMLVLAGFGGMIAILG